MRRLYFSLWLVAWCAAGLWGCGPSANTIAGKSLINRSQPPQDLLADNPRFERSEARPSRRVLEEESLGKSDAGFSKSTSQDRTAPPNNLAKFDEDLLQLIEEELANTPEEEREQFYRDVISLQPAMVRQIIHTRRIVRQVGQEAPNPFATAEPMADRNTSGIQQVSGEQASDIPPPPPAEDSSRNVLGGDPRRDPGLGAVDPWNRPTQSHQPSASGGWTNDPNRPPADMPFNQIPAFSGTGHSTGYTPSEPNALSGKPGERDSGNMVFSNVNPSQEIQPLPGGAQTPAPNPGETVPGLPPAHSSMMHQNARIPGDYNPQSPPVPNYGPKGSDPFAVSNAQTRTASSNPNQAVPGVANTLGLEDSFGPLPNVAGRSNLNPANKPVDKADLARLIASMEADVSALRFADQTQPAQKTAYVQKHVYLRMLYLMAGQEARAVTAIPDIPPADQEFWQQTFWAMSNYFDVNSMPDQDYRATQTIAQLRTAIQKLQENARLELRNVAFCHKISSFGNFDRFPQDEFGPGQPVLVYAEVVNFQSNPTALPQKPNETFYQTQLKSSIEIHRLGPSGELVERFEFEPTEDLCHNHRRDYFHSYEFTIPQRISLGPHVMTLTVEDQLSRKVATYRLNFMVK